MKSSLLTLLLGILIASMLSCSNACDDIDCNNNGSCDDGTCICDDGYEGSACEAEVNEKFLGTWISNDYVCTALTTNPTEFIIEKGSSIKEVILINADQQDIRLTGTITDTRIEVAPQSIGSAIYQGSMTIVNDVIQMEFDVALDNGDIVCTGTANRK